jgi:hypothetical protein
LAKMLTCYKNNSVLPKKNNHLMAATK